MNKRQIVATLLQAAEQLDNRKNFKDANTLMHIANRVSQMRFDESNPDFGGEEAGYMGEDNHDALMDTQTEMAHSELQDLERNPNPTPEDLEHIAAIKRWLKKQSPEFQQDHFRNTLQDAGAQVADPSDPFFDE